MIKRIFIGLIAIAVSFSNICSVSAGNPPTNQSYPTGLIPLSPEQDQHIKKNWKRIKKVRLNKLGQERVNKEVNKRKKGRAAANKGKNTVGVQVGAATETLDTSRVVADTKDLEFEPDPAVVATSVSGANVSVAGGTQTVVAGATGLPAAVDNSQTIWFPPIGDQGSLGSCASFGITYYQLSYTQARNKNLTLNTGDRNFIYSPKFVYNLVNGGKNGGSSIMAPYMLLASQGAPSWAQFPYDSNYRAWPLDAATWRSALNARTLVPSYSENLHTATGLQQLKELVNNGHIVGFATDIYNWQYTTVKNNPNTADDDALVGQSIAYYSKGSMYTSGHAITIVGYNDNIWTDINGNDLVETGELGALKIANSWTAGWRNAGFIWLSYDALKATSGVPGAPSLSRNAAIWDNRGYVLLIQSNYTPKLLGQFTMKQASRQENYMSVARCAANSYISLKKEYPEAFYKQGGAFAYDGSTVAVDGTFVVDFTNVLPTDVVQSKYELLVWDATPKNPTTIRSFKLINPLTKAELATSLTPITIDGTATGPLGQSLVVNYTYNPVTYMITTSAVNGFVTNGPEQPRYDSGSQVQLTATPNYGYVFASWSGDVTGTSNPAMVTMDNNKNIVANFVSANTAPVVNAGAAQSAVFGATVTLQGIVTDDDFPMNKTMTTTWSMVSGPGTVTFADTTNPETTAVFSKAGDYILKLTASDGELTACGQIAVTVTLPVNKAPVVEAGLNLTTTAGVPVTMTGTLADDGLPTKQIIAMWMKWSGPGIATYTTKPGNSYFTRSLGEFKTEVLLSTVGVYTFRLYANDGELTAYDEITITVKPPANKAPFVFAGPDLTATVNKGLALTGTFKDDGLPIGKMITMNWVSYAGPASPMFTYQSSLKPIVTFTAAGVYKLRFYVNDGELTAYDEIIVTVKPALNNPPVILAGPDLTAKVNTPLALTGTVTDDGFPLGKTLGVYWGYSGPARVSFTPTMSANTKATFTVAGVYTLMLYANDGEFTTYDQIIVTVK